ncbi:MAG: hypothetical protein IJL73_03170 [Lachnospiraceae bacterium]|nr:hypothetical protein [Lachnospiraceae bacterium]
MLIVKKRSGSGVKKESKIKFFLKRALFPTLKGVHMSVFLEKRSFKMDEEGAYLGEMDIYALAMNARGALFAKIAKKRSREKI